MTNPKAIAAVLLVAAAIVAAGCLSLGQTSQSSMETVSRGTTGLNYGGAAAPAPFAPATKTAGDQATVGGTSADQTVETKIIKTGQVTIEVPAVPAAIDRVRDIATSNGGYLSSSNIYTSTNDRKTGYATIRIPADRFDTVMQALAPLGKILSSSEQRSDVTEQYVDLTIQNQSYHAQLDNYYRLMDKATDVEDIIKIQAQIDQITLSLNQIEGRLRYLNSQIDLSTITVNLQEPEPVGGETGYNIITAINEGIAGFFGMISAIIVFVFSIIPLVIIALVAYAIYRYHRKRRGGSAVAPMAPVQTKA
jgi:ABC-type glycerol-3-phosphate transport system permease component